MELGKFLIATLVFLFSVFLFVPLNDGIASMNQTAVGSLVPVIQVFPLIFIVISAVFPIFFLISGDKK